MSTPDETTTSEPTETVLWKDSEGRLVEFDVPRAVADKIFAGEMVSFRPEAEPTRRPIDEALKEIGDQRAGLRARRDQIRSELDRLVTEHPELKAQPRSRPPDEAA
jgi:hypothetical protein